MYTGKSTKKTLKGWPTWASLPVGFLVRLSVETEQNLGIVLKGNLAAPTKASSPKGTGYDM